MAAAVPSPLPFYSLWVGVAGHVTHSSTCVVFCLANGDTEAQRYQVTFWQEGDRTEAQMQANEAPWWDWSKSRGLPGTLAVPCAVVLG